MFSHLAKGSVLDIGCGDGRYAASLHTMGFNVTAADMDSQRFQYHHLVKFHPVLLNDPLPFLDKAFDYVLLAEVIEHLRNPFSVIGEINRILKPSGSLILSTPNILNVGSRMRFFFEGSFDFFREPTLEYALLNKNNLQNIHIVVWRYQELEYLLFENDFRVETLYADFLKPELRIISALFLPFLEFRCYLKRKRTQKKGGVDYKRIHNILLSKELLCGRHLIVQARKCERERDA